MSFYDLDKDERSKLVAKINQKVLSDLEISSDRKIIIYFSDDDTYIRKTAYLAIGRIYKTKSKLRKQVLNLLAKLFRSENEKIRQTVINAAGEIVIIDFNPIEKLMEVGLFDEHHSVRNAVIGSIKKMSEKNPEPSIAFAHRFLQHEDYEIRREICHGIELRGRTHPQDILPLLKKLQHDKKARVRNTLIHVLGQIAYKKGCLETVIAELKTWKNKELVQEALAEIIDVHGRYKNFSMLTQTQAIDFIEMNYP